MKPWCSRARRPVETQAHLGVGEWTLRTHTPLSCLPLHGVTGVGVSLPTGTAAEGGGAGWHVQEASKHTLGSSGSTVTH